MNVPGAASTATLDGLDYGVTYTVSIVAHGPGGDSPPVASNPVRTEGGGGEGRTMGGVIKADTLWLASAGTYTVSSTVQVASDRKLFLGPGVDVLGATTPLFLVHGLLRIAGSEAAPVVVESPGSDFFSTSQSPGTAGVEIDHAVLRNGRSIVPASGNEQYAYLRLTNSTITNMSRFSYLWYPAQPDLIEGNTFADSAGFIVMTDSRNRPDATAVFRRNRFVTAPLGGYWISGQASYGTPIRVEANTFATPGTPSIRLEPGYSGVAIDAGGNYWGTTDLAVVDAMVFDSNDDIRSAGVVPVEPILTTDDPSTPLASPHVPTGVIAERQDGALRVSWTAPVSSGGRAITGYVTTATPGGATCRTEGATACTVTGLTNGTPYSVRVRATNSEGVGPASAASEEITPAGLPSRPLNVNADAGTGSISISWSAAEGNGTAVTGYIASASPGGAFCTTAYTTACQISGLDNESTYTVSVAATNAVGTGEAAAAPSALTPSARPGAPSIYSVSTGRGYAIVRWWQPSPDRGPYTSYEVTAWPGGRTCVQTSELSCRFDGLENGRTFSFTVRAFNQAGAGPDSAPSLAATPATEPTAPTEVTARFAEDRTAEITWAAPASNGSPITSYEVRSPSDYRSICTTSGATSCTIPFTYGQRYQFQVRARNGVGAGPWSVASDSVTPVAAPDSPNVVSAQRGDGTATVSWSGAHYNGAEITLYEVTAQPGGATCTTAPYWRDAQRVGPDRTCVIGGLINGTTYRFTVRATNSIGTGPPSLPTYPVTPAGLPRSPTEIVVAAGASQLTVSWLPAESNGSPIAEYVASASGLTCRTTGETTCTIVGLTNGQRYWVSVQAINAVGASPASSQNVPGTPGTAPGAPTDVRVEAGDSHLFVQWSAAPTYGNPVTGYVARVTPGGQSCTTSGAWGCYVTELTNGVTYTVSVQASTDFGTGPASATASGTPVRGDTTAPTVRVSGPGAVSALPTATFTVNASDPGRSAATLALQCGLDPALLKPCISPVKFSGLKDGDHVFSVVAVDEAGNRSETVQLMWTVDTKAPTVGQGTPPLFVLGSTAGTEFKGSDDRTGVVNYDVRMRSAAHSGSFGDYLRPNTSADRWQATKARSVRTKVAPGRTYCFSVRARDAAGNVSPWTPDACSTTPVDDRSLKASSSWTRGKHGSDYLDTYTSTRTRKAELTLKTGGVRRLVLLANRCKGCGRVGVYIDGKLLRTINLDENSTVHQETFDLGKLSGAASRTVVIRALDKRQVRIDGLIVVRA